MSKFEELEERTHEFCKEEAILKEEMQKIQDRKRVNEDEFKSYLIDNQHFELLEIRRGALSRITRTRY